MQQFCWAKYQFLVTCGKMGQAYKSTKIYNVHNYCKGWKPIEKEAQIRTNSLTGDMRDTCDNSGKKHTWEAYDS